MAAAVGVMAAVGAAAAVGGHLRSSVGSSPVRWLLRIMPLLFRTMRQPMHRHRPMGRGGGVTPRNLITPTHRLAPAGSGPFSHGEGPSLIFPPLARARARASPARDFYR